MYCNFRLWDWKPSNKISLTNRQNIKKKQERCFIFVRNTSNAQEARLNPLSQCYTSPKLCFIFYETISIVMPKNTNKTKRKRKKQNQDTF